MPFPKAASLALPIFLLLVPAASALTAEDLWAEAQRLTLEAGTTVTATARRQGDRLVLTDIAFPLKWLDEAVDLRLERIELQDHPDGTVAVLLPARFPVKLVLSETGPDQDFATVNVSAPGFSLLIAEIGDKAEFALNAPSITLSLEQSGYMFAENEKFDLNFAIADLSLQHKMDLTAADQTLASSLLFGALHIDADIDPGTENSTAKVVFDLSDLAADFNFFVPSAAEAMLASAASEGENPLPKLLSVLGNGLSIKAGLSHGPAALVMDVNDAGNPLLVELSSQSGVLNGGLDAVALSYDAVFGKSVVNVVGDFPEENIQSVAVNVDELVYRLRFGVGDLVTPQDATLVAKVTNLILSPEAWVDIDPTGTLGDSPLSYGFDIAMRYALKSQMLDPKWQPDPTAFPPVDIVDLTLNTLNFQGFGVNLDGSGAMTFDESDLVTFPGFPVPEGKMSFTATGVNSLIDRLAAGGLIPLDEVTGLRMGLMFIAKVGKAPDSLVSELEFRAKSFYLNGLKIR